MAARHLRFRHRIGLLVALAGAGLVAVTAVTLVLGRRSEAQISGIETRYVPLIEANADLKILLNQTRRALEDAANAADEDRLADADRLAGAFVRRVQAAHDTIASNGGDPAGLEAVFQTYYTRARAISADLIAGTPAAQLAGRAEDMASAQRAVAAALDRATSPDRERLAAAFHTARASQALSLRIDIAVAAGALALMGLLSWRLIRRTVRSLHAVSQGVERLARGDFDEEIVVPAGDEVGELARQANQTAARLRDLLDETRSQADELRVANATLQVAKDDADAANRELEAFSYSVSHDLRSPLRAIDGFSQALLERYEARLDDKGADYLHRVRNAAQRMGELIDALLQLSRINRMPLTRRRVDLSEVARGVVDELARQSPEREVACAISDGLVADADGGLVRVLLDNLIGNAWKFTARTEPARVEVGADRPDGETVYFVRDNGAGFDMTYASKLFAPFQRLHSTSEFTGTGIGLATVHRVVDRHGGRVWAEGEVGRGATIFFTLTPASPGGPA